MKTNRDKAEELLRHYMKTVWRTAGLTWTSVHDGEMDQFIGLIQDMVNETVQEHAESAPHIYADGSTA